MLPHPYANLFPKMDEKSLRELTASIREDGLQESILTFEGKILDGRNRALACANAQVKPRYEKYKGDNALGFVIRANLHRRHLTTSQRAAVAAELANLEHGQKTADTANAVTQDEAARMLNVSTDSLQRAKKVTCSAKASGRTARAFRLSGVELIFLPSPRTHKKRTGLPPMRNSLLTEKQQASGNRCRVASVNNGD